MKILFTILIFFSFENIFGQNSTIIIQRNCVDSFCSKKLKLQYKFNPKGDILEYTIFGTYENPDTTYLGFVSKFQYKHSKLLSRRDYTDKHLINSADFLYKKRRLDNIKYKDGESLKYFYDKKGNIKLNVMKKDLDTIRIITYSYKENKLVEIFRYNNKIENEKTTYSKSNDTIIEIVTRNDSIYTDKVWKVVHKKKYHKQNLIYSSTFYEDESGIEKFIKYNSYGNIQTIQFTYIEEDLIRKEKSEILYDNGVIKKIQEFVFINNIWQPKNLIIFYREKPYKKLKEKTKKKINLYFTKNYKSTI